MRNLGFGTRYSSVALLTGLAWIVRVGCIAVVLYVLANAVWYFVVGSTDEGSETSQFPIASNYSRTVDTAKILDANLFGAVWDGNQTPVIEDLKETTLNLSLEGTFIPSDSQSDSVALISSRDRRGVARQYREGDAVASFAAIEEIRPRFVVISRGGEHEMLAFDVDNVFFESPTVQTRQPVTSTPPRVTNAIPEFNAVPTLQDLDPNQWRNASIEDLKPLGLTEIQTNEGPMLGIAKIDGTSPLARLGMQPGDIVVSVNGVPLNVLREDEELTRVALSEDTARFEIRRHKRHFFLTVPIR